MLPEIAEPTPAPAVPAPSPWLARARRAWPRSVWIDGDGPHALLAPCRGALSVTLWPTREEAERQRARLYQCGGRCLPGLHRVADLHARPATRPSGAPRARCT